MTKQLPLYFPFIASGLYIILISYFVGDVSKAWGRVIYSIPYDIITIIVFLFLSGISSGKITNLVKLSTIYGLVGSILFLIVFLYMSKDAEKSLITSAVVASIVWLIYGFFVFLK